MCKGASSEKNSDEAEPASSVVPQKTPRLTVLVLLSALAALPVNMIVPALPEISETFHASFALVNLAIAGFAIVTAFIEAIGGTLSDRYGRKPVILIALAIFILASIGCAFSPNIAVFLFFRMLQACVSPCYSVALVMIKETSNERTAASRFGYIAMGWALAPMIGPLIGGAITELFGWRANFFVFLLLGVSAFAMSWFVLEETSQKRSESKRVSYVSSYKRLLCSRLFMAYTLCMACSTGTLYIFLGGAPLTADSLVGGSSATLGLYMGLVPVGFILGSYVVGRMALKTSPGSILLFARVLTCAGLIVGLIWSYFDPISPFAFFGPCLFIGLGNGLTMPAANDKALSVDRDLVGMAAGLSTAIRVGIGAGIAAISGLFLSGSTTILFFMLLVSATLALVAAVYATFLDRCDVVAK